MRLPGIKAASIFPKRLVHELEFSHEKCAARIQLGNGVSRLPILLLGERSAARLTGSGAFMRGTSPEPQC
jgi:hypothetical protein